MRITSAPICASVMPPSCAATKAAASTTRSPERTPWVMSVAPWCDAQRALHEAARHHLEREGFLGALEDREHACVHKVAAHGRLLRVAHAAVQLQRLARDQLGRAAGQQLDQAGLHAAVAAIDDAGH